MNQKIQYKQMGLALSTALLFSACGAVQAKVILVVEFLTMGYYTIQ